MSNRYYFAVLLMAILFTGFKLSDQVPKAWDMDEIKRFHLPPPASGVEVSYLPEQTYSQIPEFVIYPTYPVYVAEYLRPGYLDSLRSLSPKPIDFETLENEEDWIRAGRAVFHWPVAMRPARPEGVRDTQWLNHSGTRWTEKGVLPYTHYVRTPNGLMQGTQSCASCHTRIVNGKAVKGGQGDFPFDRSFAKVLETNDIPFNPAGPRSVMRSPWAADSIHWVTSREEQLKFLKAVPKGAMVRQGCIINNPIAIPSLIGIKDIKYLDRTGLMKHENIGDLMRYAAFNQGMDMLTSYDGFIPMAGITRHEDITDLASWRHPFGNVLGRYSDKQLYALAKYIYSLKPPKNPNTFSKEVLAKGERIFITEGCVTCHPPPLYTNNMLVPANGYEPSEAELEQLDVFNIPIGTDSVATLYSRRGTGYYKIPSLRGLWMRDAFFHAGNLGSIDEVLDPARLEADFQSTGFVPPGQQNKAVKGHPFGLELPKDEKEALIAYLKTL